MDGKAYLYNLRQTLQEGSSSTFLDDRTSYEYGYQAACEFVFLTKCFTDSKTITSVASQSLYELPAEFLAPYIKDDDNDHVIKFNNGSNTSFIKYRGYAPIYVANNTVSSDTPNNFTILSPSSTRSTITGTATADGAATYGECTLTDSTKSFLTTVNVGDCVHNVTDSSDGYVIEVLTNTTLTCALFGGTANDWTSADVYYITPQPLKRLMIDPAPATSGMSYYVPYMAKPRPVFSHKGIYPFSSTYMPAIVKYAAWLYKYRDMEPNFGDAWYKYWEMQTRRASSNENTVKDRRNWSVSFRKRSYSDRSYR